MGGIAYVQKHEYEAMKAEITSLRAENERLRANGREAIAAWMFEHSYATGHGDTIEDLLVELEGQAKERLRVQRDQLLAALQHAAPWVEDRDRFGPIDHANTVRLIAAAIAAVEDKP